MTVSRNCCRRCFLSTAVLAPAGVRRAEGGTTATTTLLSKGYYLGDEGDSGDEGHAGDSGHEGDEGDSSDEGDLGDSGD